MILEFLQPEPSLLDGATVLLRAALYATSLTAAGAGLLLALAGSGLGEAPRALARRWLMAAALAGIAVSLASLPLRALVLTGGESAFDGATWQAMMGSRIGDAFWLRLAGLLLLLGGALRWTPATALAAMGALMVAASYAALGHSTLYRPRQELAALVTLHLMAVGFWVGSLPLLWRAAQAGDGALLARWSPLGAAAVGVLAGTGLLLAILLVRRWDFVLASWYGWGMMAKLLLVAAMVALAVRHRFLLTPALARGEPGAGARLARSIRWEAGLALLVFWAAAEMVSVHPLDAGHRISS
jgi:putative copper export protein